MTSGTRGAVVGAGSSASASPARFLDYVERILAAADPGRPLAIQAAVPDLAPADLVAQLGDGAGYFWRDRAGRTMAGVGRAAAVVGSGPGRFRQVRDRASALLDALELHTFGDAEPVPPRLFGGFAFQPGDADDASWDGFGDAHFALPALSCATVDGIPLLTVALPAGRDRDSAAATLAHLRAVVSRGSGGPDRAGDEPSAGRDRAGPSSPPRPPGPDEDPDGAAYRRLVAGAVSAIRRGELEKVVLARRTTMDAGATAIPAAVEALSKVEGTFRFAHVVDGALFLGATPERLISVRGGNLHTEAVAGTAGAGGDRALLNGGGKDRWEHELVVRAIAAALEPVATLRRDPSPVVRSAGPVRHLATRFEGTLERDEHVLELVRRLHPTPAVGGAPGPESLAWIAAHEPAPRGWYSGPIGWFDAEGDGEFAVALRCGLLRDGRLALYAGSGIVAGSKPDAEYEETRLKLMALPGALGLG